MATSTLQTRRTPQWKTVYDKLLHELSDCAYGSDFYTLAQVTERFGVSDITARRVLTELAGAGFIQKRRARPPLVLRPNKTQTVYLVEAQHGGLPYMNRDVIKRRILAGVISLAEARFVEFDSIGDSYVRKKFSRSREGSFGFLVPEEVGESFFDFLRDQQLPYVVLDPFRRLRDQPYVRANRFQAGYQAARHLLELGHRRIAFAIGSIARANFRSRLKGYRAALKEAGLEFDWSLVHETDPIHNEEAQCLDALLRLRSPPTAIIAGDDQRAIQLLEACGQQGLAVPNDMSLVGYPNYAESKLCDPPLTVIDPRYERVGKVALNLLLEQMLSGAEPSRQACTIKPRLIQRESTGPVPECGGRAAG